MMERDAAVIAEKVAAILAKSANEPGINEMNELIRATADARQFSRDYENMALPTYTTQSSHSHV